jgi:hypothetical protein
VALTPAVLANTSHWLAVFAADWHGATPLRLHSRDIDPGGAPELHPEFMAWLTREARLDGTTPNAPSQYRIKSAMRRLRKAAVREYEVVYRVMVLREPIPSVASWLNERAIRGGHPERYREKDVVAIVQSGVDKLIEWY